MKKQNEQAKRRTAAQKRVLKCLEETHGVVTSAVKKAKVSRTQFYKWINDDDTFKKEVEEIQDSTLDFVGADVARLTQWKSSADHEYRAGLHRFWNPPKFAYLAEPL